MWLLLKGPPAIEYEPHGDMAQPMFNSGTQTSRQSVEMRMLMGLEGGKRLIFFIVLNSVLSRQDWVIDV